MLNFTPRSLVDESVHNHKIPAKLLRIINFHLLNKSYGHKYINNLKYIYIYTCHGGPLLMKSTWPGSGRVRFWSSSSLSGNPFASLVEIHSSSSPHFSMIALPDKSFQQTDHHQHKKYIATFEKSKLCFILLSIFLPKNRIAVVNDNCWFFFLSYFTFSL